MKISIHSLLCILSLGLVGCSPNFNVKDDINNTIPISLKYGKKTIIDISYNKKFKGAIRSSYIISKRANEANPINDRPSFYSEKSIPKEYRSQNSDYINSGFERGHLAPHASFDYSAKMLDLTYSFANIVPQYPNVNKKTWIKAEKFERAMIKFGDVKVNNYVIYNKKPKTIGKNKIAIPKAFIKEIIIDDVPLCFYFLNEKNPDTSLGLFSYKIDCKRVIK